MVFLELVFMQLRVKRVKKTRQFHFLSQRVLSKERAIHQLRNLRLEFGYKFLFDLSFVTFSILVLLVLRKLPSREAGGCILEAKA